jgi:hypothetical protein
MITFSAYESYFENLAKDFKPISHTDEAPRFAMMDIDDIISSQRTGLDFTNPCMILENFEGEIQYKHNQLADQQYGAFLIIQQVDRNNPVQKREVLDRCKDYGIRLITWMQIERKALFGGDHEANRILLYFDMNQVRYQKISNIFSGCHGWRFEIKLGEEAALPFNRYEWYSLAHPDPEP